jgi:hypothetical protein
MKREVVICDTANCRRLSDGKCVLCAADHCSEHMTVKLALSFKSVSPRSVQNPQQPQFSEYGEGIQDPICLDCAIFLGDSAADGVMGAVIASHGGRSRQVFHARLLATFSDLVNDLKALKAAHRLGARGEDLLNVVTPEKP